MRHLSGPGGVGGSALKCSRTPHLNGGVLLLALGACAELEEPAPIVSLTAIHNGGVALTPNQ